MRLAASSRLTQALELMSIAPSLKAIVIGALVIVGGYVLCMFFVGALASLSAPRWAWFVLAAVAATIAATSGFVGALFARANPIANGTLSGFAGAIALLAALWSIAPSEVNFAFLGPLLSVTFLALVGALIAVYVWPRHAL